LEREEGEREREGGERERSSASYLIKLEDLP